KKVVIYETVTTRFDFPTKEFTDLVETKIMQNLRKEGFFLHKISAESKSFHCQKELTVIMFHVLPQHITFETSKNDVAFIKTIVYETLLNLHITIDKVRDLAKPESLKKDIIAENGSKYKFDIRKVLDPASIVMELKAENKYDSIKELVDVLAWNGKIKDKENVLEAVWERESTMSTGMQYGVAIPHSRTDAVNRITVAIGFKHSGIDFQALDGLPSRVIILLLSPLDEVSPHIQFLSAISTYLNTQENVNRLLRCENIEAIYSYFKKS
ncbi:PTS sugar transporter subunit IIA, partial [candidate division KSB1 bacterium]|nr:PTS sugar transporter subunit IIA [candidate division KSB1 bacterium]